MSSLVSLYQTLELKIGEMEGEWVAPKNAYESRFCQILGWECVNRRYCDAITPSGHLVELKKGQASMWYDMVRYAEIFLGIGDQNTVTVFLRWSKKKMRVTEIYVIDTVEILKFLKMDEAKAHTCILYKRDAPRGLNMQASMTALDMRSVASKIIYNPFELLGKKVPSKLAPRLQKEEDIEWKRVVSKTTGKPYWLNEANNQSTWTNPFTVSPWRPIVSKSSGKMYWYNQVTNDTTWDRPLYCTQGLLNGRDDIISNGPH